MDDYEDYADTDIGEFSSGLYSELGDSVVRNNTWNQSLIDRDELLALLWRQYFEYVLNVVIVPILFSLISLIGVLGNALVIYVIVTCAPMRTNTNLLLLNVAAGDFAFVLIIPPLTAYQFATSNWPFGDFACRMMHYVVNVIAYVTVYTLVLVAVLRYMTIVRDNDTVRSHTGRHAGTLCRLRTRRNVLLAIGAVWVGMAVVNTPILTAYRSTLVQQSSDRWHVCLPVSLVTARNIFIAFFVCDYVLPLVIIGFISFSIYRHITVHGMTVSQNANRGTALQKKRAIRLLVLVVIAFAVLLLPIHIHLLVGLTIGPLEQKYPWYEVLQVIWHCLMYCNSCVNPFIYNHASQDFRNGFRDVMWRWGFNVARSTAQTSVVQTPTQPLRETVDTAGTGAGMRLRTNTYDANNDMENSEFTVGGVYFGPSVRHVQLELSIRSTNDTD